MIQKVKKIFKKTKIKENLFEEYFGGVEETEDDIVCYIDYQKFKKNEKMLKSIDENEEKSICYVFENINFDDIVCFGNIYSKFIFRNCTFNRDVYLENCVAASFFNCYFGGGVQNNSNRLFMCINLFSLKICNCLTSKNWSVKIRKISDFNSVDSQLNLTNLEAKKASIQTCNLYGDNVFVEVDSLEFIKSSFDVTSKLVFINKSLNNVANIAAPNLYFNGSTFVNQDSFAFNEEDSQRFLNLQNIIIFLKMTRDNINAEKQRILDARLKEISDNLDNQPIGNVVKVRK